MIPNLIYLHLMLITKYRYVKHRMMTHYVTITIDDAYNMEGSFSIMCSLLAVVLMVKALNQLLSLSRD